MSHTLRSSHQFRKELGEAMAISLTRRAKDHRDVMRQIRDFVFDDETEAGDITFVRSIPKSLHQHNSVQN